MGNKITCFEDIVDPSRRRLTGTVCRQICCAILVRSPALDWRHGRAEEWHGNSNITRRARRSDGGRMISEAASVAMRRG